MKYIFIICILFMTALGARAEDTMGAISWNVGFPLADTKEYVGETSLRGIGFETRKFVQSNVSVGVFLSWNTFHEVRDELLSLPNGHVHGTQHRVLHTFPMLASAQYYFRPFSTQQRFIPYAGLGMGVFFVDRVLDIGMAGISENHLRFGFAPEAGLAIPVDRHRSTLISVKYNHAFKVDDTTDYSYWSVNIGIAISQ